MPVKKNVKSKMFYCDICKLEFPKYCELISHKKDE